MKDPPDQRIEQRVTFGVAVTDNEFDQLSRGPWKGHGRRGRFVFLTEKEGNLPALQTMSWGGTLRAISMRTAWRKPARSAPGLSSTRQRDITTS